jgi:UDP-N-acetylglucosamine--N-acetylmuramyl-(pentapeptide) pyrophosphoryl-undecaprenol N-acetylglucosamine transferase
VKILVTGGGTAGHVTPLLAVASEIVAQQPDAKVRYIGKYKDPMSSAVSDHSAIEKDYKICAGKLRRFHGKSAAWYLTQPKLVLRNIIDIFLLIFGTVQSFFILLFWRPKVIFVKGGYVGLPVGLAAIALRIPVVTHDSDALPGLANRVLAKHAAALAVGAPIEQYPQYASKNVHFTGVPVRDDFLHPPSQDEAKQALAVASYTHVIAIVGGSLGAVRVNNAILENLSQIATGHTDRAVLWFTGTYGFDEITQKVSKTDFPNVFVQPYTHDLPTVFAAATVVITRAGATTLAELSIMKKPIIVIPNPLLTGGHQTKNAQMLAEKNAAVIVQEEALDTLPQAIDSLLADVNLQNELGANFAAFSNAAASSEIAALIIQTAQGK